MSPKYFFSTGFPTTVWFGLLGMTVGTGIGGMGCFHDRPASEKVVASKAFLSYPPAHPIPENIAQPPVKTSVEVPAWEVPQEPVEMVAFVFTNLQDLPLQDSSRCSPETHVPDRGLRGLYCRLMPVLSFAQISRILPFPIYIRGPHSPTDGLVTNDHGQFGYHNPLLLQWIKNSVLPKLREQEVLEATKASFAARLESQCFVYHSTYRYIRNEGRTEYEKALANYRQSILSGNFGPHSPHRILADQVVDSVAYAFEKKGFDYYEAETSLFFWARRDIDGTADDWASIFKDLLVIYAPDRLR